jgi:hypothetical protein
LLIFLVFALPNSEVLGIRVEEIFSDQKIFFYCAVDPGRPNFIQIPNFTVMAVPKTSIQE